MYCCTLLVVYSFTTHIFISFLSLSCLSSFSLPLLSILHSCRYHRTLDLVDLGLRFFHFFSFSLFVLYLKLYYSVTPRSVVNFVLSFLKFGIFVPAFGKVLSCSFFFLVMSKVFII